MVTARARFRRSLASATLLGAALSSGDARAQVFGPDVPHAGEEVDPQRPYGDPIVATARPDVTNWLTACSLRLPVCVHGEPPIDGATVVGALASVERAWETAADVLHAPPPDPGDTLAYRVYLVDSAGPHGDALGSAWSATRLASRDVRSAVDRASAFSFVDRALTGCALDAALARELVRASIYRTSPSTDEGTARAEASYLARLVVPCAMSLPDGVEVFQAHPQRALVDERAGAAYDDGAALFFWWLDYGYGDEPGDLIVGIWSRCVTETALGASAWVAHPNAFDLLHSTFAGAHGKWSSVDDIYARFAVARAFMGSADDGTHLPESRGLGSAGFVLVDWGAWRGDDIAWPVKPRAFASPDSVAPTGAAYVVVHHAGAPPGAKLFVEATWEAFNRMRWTVVKLDARGKVIGEVPLAGRDRATTNAAVVGDIDAAADLLIVGASLGDRTHRFDPADSTWWTHGWVLTIEPR